MRRARKSGFSDYAATGSGLEFRPPTARCHELCNDRQPQAASAAVEIAAPESLERALALLGCEARPRVDDLKDRVRPVNLHDDGDFGSRGTYGERVVKVVVNDLLRAGFDREHGGVFWSVTPNRHVEFVRERLPLSDSSARIRCEVGFNHF
jgi:hypothetical protein